MYKPKSVAASQRLSYAIWAFIFAISLLGALIPQVLFSANISLCLSISLVTFASLRIRAKQSPLSQKEASLARILLSLFCATQILQFSQSLSPASPFRGFDFSAYYIAGKVVSQQSTQTLYELPRFPDGRMNLSVGVSDSSLWQADAVRYRIPFAAPYIYPPFVAVMMKPITCLSFSSAYLAWNLATVVLSVASLFLMLNMWDASQKPFLGLMFSVGLLCYYPLLNTLFFGQIGGVNLFLLTAALWLLSRKRIVLSALCFAAATVIKLTPVLAIPVLIFHRRWKWLLAYVSWISVLLLFSVWQAGWTAHLAFWQEVLPSISSGAPVSQNHSVVAWVQELVMGRVPLAQNPPHALPRYASGISKLVAFAAYGIILLRLYRRHNDQDIVRDLVVVILAGLAVSPISWINHFTIALIPFVYFWCKVPRGGAFILLSLFAVVATDTTEILRLLTTNPIIQILIAAIIPTLTLTLAFIALAPPRRLTTA